VSFDPLDLAEVSAALREGRWLVHYARCEECISSCHHEPCQWHPWAGVDDLRWAAEHGHPDPSGQRCACFCADGPRDIGDALQGPHGPADGREWMDEPDDGPGEEATDDDVLYEYGDDDPTDPPELPGVIDLRRAR
jgi:hypothetical protein